MHKAACTARRGLSSWVRGAPSRAMTPSPVYWLIVPSKRCTSAVMPSKQRLIMSCTTSGSSCSASVVKPATSANSTVTCLRSPSSALLEVRIFSARCLGVYVWGELNRGSTGLAVAVSDLPQPPQNFSPPSFRKPHERHAEANESPHSPQKRRPSRFSARHRGHCIAPLPRTWGGEGRSGGPRVAGSPQTVKDVYSSSTRLERKSRPPIIRRNFRKTEQSADKFD